MSGDNDSVQAQYEAYPYPQRNPADESRRLITGSPGNLAEINHYVFAGRRDFTRPFRALIAGGGTGDGLIQLAQQLAEAGTAAEIVYLDLSSAARKIAEARAKARRLGNIRFEQGSLLDLPRLGLGIFDYIDCCGVLHHLVSPAEGLAALTEALAKDGGIGLMLYGEIGRTGVYHAQEMLRMLAAGEPAPEQLRLARRLVDKLPATNWLRRNPYVGDHLSGGDPGLHDLLLHARDRAYRVMEIEPLLAAAGLRLAAFIEPARYDPASYLADPKLLSRIEGKSVFERAAFAELLAGNIHKHILYAVRAGNDADTVARPAPHAVPILRDHTGPELAKSLGTRDVMAAEIDGLKFTFPLPRLASPILARIDGRRNLAAIQADLAATVSGLNDRAFADAFALLYRAFNGINRMLLADPSGSMT